MPRARLPRTLVLMLLLSAASAPAGAQALPPWIAWDPAARRVKMEIVAAKDTTNGGWNFNGHAGGNLTVTVPLGSAVEIAFQNADVLPHSLVVTEPRDPIPPQNGAPAFSRAFTVSLVPGIVQGKGDTLRFTADRPGRFWLFCGVPTHGIGGMWDWFVVSADAQAPSVATRGTP